VSAERAVSVAFEQTGVRIVEVPELYARGRHSGSVYDWHQAGAARVCNRWRLTLERDISLRGLTTRSVQVTRELFVGPVDCLSTDRTAVLQIPTWPPAAEVTIQYLDTGVAPPILRSRTIATASPVDFELAERVSPPKLGRRARPPHLETLVGPPCVARRAGRAVARARSAGGRRRLEPGCPSTARWDAQMSECGAKGAGGQGQASGDRSTID
jgi:hypothetical protein